MRSQHFAVGEALNLKWLMEKVEELPVETRWHAHARGALRDELNAQQRSLVSQMFAMGTAGDGAIRIHPVIARPGLAATRS